MKGTLVKAGATLVAACLLNACSTAYQARPVPFELPQRYANATAMAGATVAAHAYPDTAAANRAFGFDVIDAGLLPVQVVFDNQGDTALVINPSQTFLEDAQGRLWPVLNERFAYERVTKYAQTRQVFQQGAYGGFLGGVAGALVGAAIGVVTGQDVSETARQGAASGASSGAVLGGTSGLANAERARQKVMADFRDKSLQNQTVRPGDIAYGFIFFPGEAGTPRTLRLQLLDPGNRPHTHSFDLSGQARAAP